MQKLFTLIALLMLCATTTYAQTIVERHGQLSVDGNRIVDECGRTAQLKGMSYFWSQWEGKEYYNANTVRWLRDDWRAEIVRAALGVREGAGGDDYIAQPSANYNRVTALLDGAVEHGVYGIADFHAHYADRNLNEAKTFFRQISQRYGDTPNIIYEIWNEPIGDYGDAGGRATWRSIKAYAREVISVIRDNDPDGLIVVGTPFYDQRPDLAAEDPLTTDSKNRPVGNVAYTIHAYAGAHKQQVRDWGQEALDAGLALMMTECGTTGTDWDNNFNDFTEFGRWVDWMDARGISYAIWSMSDKNELNSALEPNANVNGGWPNSELRSNGEWYRNHLRSENSSRPSVCTGGGGTDDDIVSTTAPSSVQRGQNVTVTVNYSASTNRDILVWFQRDNNPFTKYVERKIDVNQGSGTVSTQFTIPNSVPIVNNDYQIQVLIVPNGATEYGDRLDNVNKNNIDVTATTSTPSTSNVNIYTDNLNNSWANWSWGGTATVRDAGIKYAGSHSFKYNLNNGGGVSFRHPNGLSSNNLIRLEFWARTWSGNTNFQVSGSYDDNLGNAGSEKTITVTSSWKKFSISKAELGNYGWYKRFFIQNGSTSSTIFLDNVRLVYSGGSSNLNTTPSLAAANDVRAFPNPSQGTFTVDLDLTEAVDDLSVEVFDLSGRQVLRRQRDAVAGSQRFELTLPGQSAAGVYLLRLSDESGDINLTRRLVVE